jgi:hypothetical protein
LTGLSTVLPQSANSLELSTPQMLAATKTASSTCHIGQLCGSSRWFRTTVVLWRSNPRTEGAQGKQAAVPQQRTRQPSTGSSTAQFSTATADGAVQHSRRSTACCRAMQGGRLRLYRCTAGPPGLDLGIPVGTPTPGVYSLGPPLVYSCTAVARPNYNVGQKCDRGLLCNLLENPCRPPKSYWVFLPAGGGERDSGGI